MKISWNCLWEIVFNFSMGFFFFLGSLCLLVLGASSWPVIGFVLAGPTLWMAFRYYSRKPSKTNCPGIDK
jgi:uncharacterized membrane protein